MLHAHPLSMQSLIRKMLECGKQNLRTIIRSKRYREVYEKLTVIYDIAGDRSK